LGDRFSLSTHRCFFKFREWLKTQKGSRQMDSNTFGAILIFLVAMAIPAGALLLGHCLGSRTKKGIKLEPYECGVDNPVGSARQRFSVKFYLVAMIFLVFDLEVAFLYPWAVTFRDLTRILGPAAFFEMLFFLGVLFLGYVYLWRKGALDWEE